MKKGIILLSLFIVFAFQSKAQIESHKWKISFEPTAVAQADGSTTYNFYSFLPIKMVNGKAVFAASMLSFNPANKKCIISSDSGSNEGTYMMSDDTHITLIFEGIKHSFTIIPESHHVMYLSGESGRIQLLGEH